jgi:hypothetical protein
MVGKIAMVGHWALDATCTSYYVAKYGTLRLSEGRGCHRSSI